ncbi:hypothetical protein Q8F55_006668 [Vanrija albida]|uniref:Transmembrane protein 242 n=1 Tax=Vanrija albida TaxID=181172 RepID=A0ABR3PXR8_9TREE
MSSWGSSSDGGKGSGSGSAKDGELPAGTRGLSPYEIQITKDAIRRRIDAGEISQADIDVLNSTYRTMAGGLLAGGAISFAGTLWALRRRRPLPRALFRWTAATFMGGLGSFLGFTVAGAAAALEVTRNMPDSQRKMKVFQQISIDTKRAIAEHRLGIPTGTVIEHRAGVPDSDTLITVDKYRGASGSVDAYQVEEEAASQEVRAVVDTLDTVDEAAAARNGVLGEVAKVDQPPSWEKLRTTRPPRRGPAGQPGAVDLSPEDELRKRQAEFDAMLDRERKGGNDGDKW